MAPQAGHLLGLHGFPKGLVAVLKSHNNAELTLEVAWLLALMSAGPEAHMHALVKHGGAEAVAGALSSAMKNQVRVSTLHDSLRYHLTMPNYLCTLSLGNINRQLVLDLSAALCVGPTVVVPTPAHAFIMTRCMDSFLHLELHGQPIYPAGIYCTHLCPALSDVNCSLVTWSGVYAC